MTWPGDPSSSSYRGVSDTLLTPGAAAPGNGNLFRSLTLLAVTAAEQKGCELKDVLTAQEGQGGNFGMLE